MFEYLLDVSGTAGLFFVLLNFIIDDGLVADSSAEVLHGLGVAVRAFIGADPGAGKIEGIDFQTLACDEL